MRRWMMRTWRRATWAGADTLCATAARRRSSPTCPAQEAACSGGQGAQNQPLVAPASLLHGSIVLPTMEHS